MVGILVAAVWISILGLFIIRRKLGIIDVCVIASLVALSLATNYVLIWLPNVKIMDLIVFSSGFCFGSFVGVCTGALIWAVYGSLNPYGFDFLIWIAAMICESIYGIVGGTLRRLNPSIFEKSSRKRPLLINYEFALAGLLATSAYDLLTNLVSGISFSWLYFGSVNWPIVAGIMVSGVPFALIHEFSNAVLFFFGAVPLLLAVKELREHGYARLR